MRAVVMLARSELRRRWRSVVVLTVLVGFVGAVVLALVAGGRRTETSLTRFEDFSRSARVEIDVGDATPAQIAQLRRVPGVAAVAQLYQLVLTRADDDNLAVAGQVDERFGTEVDRARVVDGRAADPRAPLELNVGESFAAAHHLEVGDRVRFESYSPEDVAISRASNTAVPSPTGPDIDFRLVGIVRRPLDLGGRGTAGGVIVLTPAFVREYRDRIGSYGGSLLRVRTDGPADVSRVTRAARRIFGSSPVFSFTSLSIEGKGAQDAIDVTTVGLFLAAAVAGLTGIVGVGIALSREVALVDTDQLTLSALGVRPRARAAAAAAVGVPIAVVGALIAVLGAALASPLFPIGVGRDAEPDPGFRVDAPALGIGVVAIVLVVLALAVLAGVRTARATRTRLELARPAGAPRLAAELGSPPPVVVGVQFALDRGHSRRALPVWSSLLGATFGITVVCAVFVFGASLDHLVSHPAAYGWTWDITAGDTAARQAGENDCSPITTRLTRVRVVTAVASICNSNVEIAGRPVASWGFGQIKGDIEPGIVKGRAPRTDDEVALGGDTLAAAGRAVGDRVVVRGPTRTLTYRVVGQSVFPSLSDPEPFADGAAFSAAGLARLGDGEGGWDLVVRLRHGTDLQSAVADIRPIAGSVGTPITARLPVEVDRVRRIESLPVALAAFVAVVALVAVGFSLVTAARRRRRDLAVLKTLGFSRRQVRATVAWHASIVGGIGLVVGIPLGLVLGRFVWHAVGDELGVATDPTRPWLGVALLVPLTLLAVNLIAAFPARAAARTRPAVVLRSE